tara:strand:+ start:234 stop:518 length:285 start_codon:yes stop_codon:yes gene_type:complete
MWPSIFIGVDMKYPQKHRNIVSQCVREGKSTVILSGVSHDVNTIAKEMGITVSNHAEHKAKTQKVDKYRKEHADLGKQDHSGDIEDAGDGISES